MQFFCKIYTKQLAPTRDPSAGAKGEQFMKTKFEFHGEGYLTLSAQGQSATLCRENPSAEFLLGGEAEIGAVHSEKEPKEKEKMTPVKIASAVILCILLSPIIVLVFLIHAFGNLYMGDGISPEKFFDENNPFITKKKFTIRPYEGKTVIFSVDNPIFNKKTREYTALPQITAADAEASEETEYSYCKAFTRTNYKADHYTECALLSILCLALAALGILFIFTAPPTAENPVLSIVGLLASLLLISFPALAVWAIVRTEKVLKETEKNILTHTKGKTET
jgi:hypothetical protein